MSFGLELLPNINISRLCQDDQWYTLWTDDHIRPLGYIACAYLWPRAYILVSWEL
jgi:hypothetical protein